MAHLKKDHYKLINRSRMKFTYKIPTQPNLLHRNINLNSELIFQLANFVQRKKSRFK